MDEARGGYRSVFHMAGTTAALENLTPGLERESSISEQFGVLGNLDC